METKQSNELPSEQVLYGPPQNSKQSQLVIVVSTLWQFGPSKSGKKIIILSTSIFQKSHNSLPLKNKKQSLIIKDFK
jgi:hypothetical protein